MRYWILVRQNKEVFINGKTLYQAFTDMGKSMDSQQGNTQPQPSTLSSSGYSSPRSRRSSVSAISEFSDKDETFESDISNNEEYEQGGNKLEDRVAALEEENARLRRELVELKSYDKRMAEEGDEGVSKFIKEKQSLEERTKKLKAELEKKIKELDEKDLEIEQLKQQIIALDRDDKRPSAKE